MNALSQEIVQWLDHPTSGELELNLSPREFPRPSQHQPINYHRLVETNIAKPDGGNLGNPNGNKREYRLVSKWRSGRLRYMVWGEHGTVPPAIIYDGKRQ